MRLNMEKNKSKKVELRKENKAKENKVEEKPKYIEKRTLEDLLKDLRIEKNWTYYNVLEELANRNVIIKEETVKKWEYGLEYPDLDMIYRLADIYGIPSEDFIIAKNNSFKEGFERGIESSDERPFAPIRIYRYSRSGKYRKTGFSCGSKHAKNSTISIK